MGLARLLRVPRHSLCGRVLAIPELPNPIICRRHLTSARTLKRKLDDKLCKNEDEEVFFRYTGGRWLWDEDRRLRERYKRFNVAEIKRIAAESVGSLQCVEMTKLAEGGFNKVFRLIMDDGKRAVARIPTPGAGHAFYTTASEVATMEFVSLPLNKTLQHELIRYIQGTRVPWYICS